MPQVTNPVRSEGTVFGYSATDKLGFYGLTTAIVQPSASAQAALTFTAVAAVTTTTPTITAFGYTSAQAAAVLDTVNLTVTGLNQVRTLLTQMRTDLVALGIIKGSA